MRIFEGNIISVGTNKTFVVSVERKVPHPLYRKLMKRDRNFLVDGGDFSVEVGTKVRIVETRPISKNKYFKIMEIVGQKKPTQKAISTKTEEKPKRVARKTTKKETIKKGAK